MRICFVLALPTKGFLPLRSLLGRIKYGCLCVAHRGRISYLYGVAILWCSHTLPSGTPTLEAGGQEGQLPPLTSSMGGRRGRIAFHTEIFPSLLSHEATFFGIVDRLVIENFLGTSPQIPKLPLCYQETNILGITLLENSWKTKIYHCGGRIHMHGCTLEETCLPTLGTCRCP